MYRLTIFPSPWDGPDSARADRIAREALEEAHGGPAGVLALWRGYLAAGGQQNWPVPDAVADWEYAVGDALSAVWRKLPAQRPDPDDPSSAWFDSVINDAGIVLEEQRDV